MKRFVTLHFLLFIFNGISIAQTGVTRYGNTALANNTFVGIYNSAFGSRALAVNSTGTKNTALGANTLQENELGSNNTAVGYASMFHGYNGNYNTAVGFYSQFWSGGSYNVSVGTHALEYNSGSYNIAIGDYSQSGSALIGSRNISIGSNSLKKNQLGENNVACGYYTLVNSTSSGSTALGSRALYNSVKSNNTGIGSSADVTSSSIQNATAIGANAKVDASNKVRIGNTSVTSIGGQVGWTNFSDARIKSDVKENVPGLSFIKLLRPLTLPL